MTITDRIIRVLRIAPSTDVSDLAAIMGESPRAIQDALHDLDERGLVRLHEVSGAYSITDKGGAL